VRSSHHQYPPLSNPFAISPPPTQQAIDLVQESFPELREVERDRIRFEVRVVLARSSNHQHRQAAEIGRSAWSVVIPTLPQYEIVEICLAEPAAASGARSSFRPSLVVAQPLPHKTGRVSDAKAPATNPFSSGSQITSSSSQSQSQLHLKSQPLTSRLASLLSRSSRGRYPA